jgi:hypothetical protein
MLRNKTTDQRFEENMSILREERIKLYKAYAEATETVGRLAHTIQLLENKIEEFCQKYEVIIEPITAFEAGAIQRQTNARLPENYSDELFDVTAFTPLKIYNGTPEGVPLEIQGQQLPINELNGTPPLGACPISNLHRCKAGALQRQTNDWERTPTKSVYDYVGMMTDDRPLTALEAGHITRDTNALMPDDESDELFASTM